MFKLILKYQDAPIQEFTFEETPVNLGRRDDNHVVIDNMAVSGHHAVIESEPPNYYVLIDLESLNGTFLNEKKITREKIFDGDTLKIGKHSLLMVDLRPESERPKRNIEREPEKNARIEKQVKVDAKQKADEPDNPLLESSEKPHEKPKKIELFGSITIISGGTPQIIDLSKRLTTLGKANESDIKCSGFLVGKTAAVINKRPNGFFLAYSDGSRKPEVNGEAITTQVQLQDGDEIVLGGTRMTFNLREEISE
jgi:pSer/pThr/pTyr-binding forkhead associated (FHA) protein